MRSTRRQISDTRVTWFFSSTMRRPPTSTLFPYTTLFRSLLSDSTRRPNRNQKRLRIRGGTARQNAQPKGSNWRSEEHTSELQSQSNLVCRLLLEKKKQGNDFSNFAGTPVSKATQRVLWDP